MPSIIWVVFLAISLFCAVLTGRLDEVSNAVSLGASEAVTLAISILGTMTFWSGMMAVIRASGLADKLSRLLMPVLRPLFGKASRDAEAMEAVSANVTANLLGLSNAATPLGLKAIDRLYTVEGRRGSPDAVLTFMVINTASIQIIPTTVAAVRSACGSETPYDIMPAVWIASIASVAVAIISSKMLRYVFPDEK